MALTQHPTTDTTAIANMDGLARRIQAFPPELYNNILDLATLSFEDEVTIDKCTYRPPVGLQINRAIRAAAAISYFQHTTFFVPLRTYYETCRDWFKLLPGGHSQLLRTINLECGFQYGADMKVVQTVLSSMRRALNLDAMGIDRDVLHVNRRYKVYGNPELATEWLNHSTVEQRIEGTA